MPPIKWNAPKFWYEIGWRPFVPGANPEPFMTQRVYPPQNQFAIPNPALNLRYQYYIKAVNQQPGGTHEHEYEHALELLVLIVEINGADANEPPLYYIAFSGDSGNFENISSDFPPTSSTPQLASTRPMLHKRRHNPLRCPGSRRACRTSTPLPLRTEQ